MKGFSSKKILLALSAAFILAGLISCSDSVFDPCDGTIEVSLQNKPAVPEEYYLNGSNDGYLDYYVILYGKKQGRVGSTWQAIHSSDATITDAFFENLKSDRYTLTVIITSSYSDALCASYSEIINLDISGNETLELSSSDYKIYDLCVVNFDYSIATGGNNKVTKLFQRGHKLQKNDMPEEIIYYDYEYIILDWYTDSGLNTELVFGTPVENNMSLYPYCADGIKLYDFYNQENVTESCGEPGGPFHNASESNPVGLKNFRVSATEITYAQWKDVYDWATDYDSGSQRYVFANKGREGPDGIDGAPVTKGKNYPVCNITWRDAVVWCNAACEKYGREPAYYSKKQEEGSYNYYDVIRTADPESVAPGNGKAENAFIRTDSYGFKLPSEVQWENAARGGLSSETAGEEKWYNDLYSGCSSVSDLTQYAVFNTDSMAEVKTKVPSDAGMYDILGNVSEMCGDYSGGKIIIRGGNYKSDNTENTDCTVSKRVKLNVNEKNTETGFRVVLY